MHVLAKWTLPILPVSHNPCHATILTDCSLPNTSDPEHAELKRELRSKRRRVACGGSAADEREEESDEEAGDEEGNLASTGAAACACCRNAVPGPVPGTGSQLLQALLHHIMCKPHSANQPLRQETPCCCSPQVCPACQP